MALGPNPHPPSPPQRKPPPILPQLCSFPGAVMLSSIPLHSLGVLDFCKCLGPRERCQESWTFHSFDYCVATPTSQCSSNFFSAMSTWPDAKRLRCGLGAELWRLSTAPLIAGFPASTALPSLGAGPLLTVEGIFLLLFPSLLPLLHLSCSLFSRIPNGSLWSLQDSSCISPLLSHHIYLFVPFF